MDAHVNPQHIKMPKNSDTHHMGVDAFHRGFGASTMTLQRHMGSGLLPQNPEIDLHRPNGVRGGLCVNPKHIKVPNHFLYRYHMGAEWTQWGV